jgi:16S rRNA (adenine1518-N6/adenine1519-N6)-dimethyltransferase
MEEAGITFRKDFGQNFLTNKMIPENIAESCTDEKNSLIIEIGPGIGCLTKELCERYENVIAYEIDKSLIPVLAYTLGSYSNVNVINEDVMKADLHSVLAPYLSGGVSVCANLPYYITTPILMMLLESGIKFDYITIMIQAEVADRLCARAGKGDYGAITAVLNYYGEAERILDVPASDFVPAPKVNSAVVRIKLHKENPYHPLDEKLFFRVIKASFEQRRKTLLNGLSNGMSDFSKEDIAEAIEACGHRSDIRGEKLSTAEFVELANKLYEIKNR